MPKVDEKIENIRQDLKDQLLEQGKLGKHFDDLIDDYVYLVKLKEKLQKDINKKGLRYTVTTGNGFETKKENLSVVNLLKVNTQQLKILQELNLKVPEEEGNDNDDLLQGNR